MSLPSFLSGVAAGAPAANEAGEAAAGARTAALDSAEAGVAGSRLFEGKKRNSPRLSTRLEAAVMNIFVSLFFFSFFRKL